MKEKTLEFSEEYRQQYISAYNKSKCLEEQSRTLKERLEKHKSDNTIKITNQAFMHLAMNKLLQCLPSIAAKLGDTLADKSIGFLEPDSSGFVPVSGQARTRLRVAKIKVTKSLSHCEGKGRVDWRGPEWAVAIANAANGRLGKAAIPEVDAALIRAKSDMKFQRAMLTLSMSGGCVAVRNFLVPKEETRVRAGRMLRVNKLQIAEAALKTWKTKLKLAEGKVKSWEREVNRIKKKLTTELSDDTDVMDIEEELKVFKSKVDIE